MPQAVWPGLLHPEPLPLWKATADPYLWGSTQTQFWLSLSGVSGSGCAQCFVWALWGSLAGMEFDSKCDFTPPPSFWDFSFALGRGVSFFGGIQHSPVNDHSAVSWNFGVLAEDEHTSLYSTILGSFPSLGEDNSFQDRLFTHPPPPRVLVSAFPECLLKSFASSKRVSHICFLGENGIYDIWQKIFIMSPYNSNLLSSCNLSSSFLSLGSR